MKKSKRLNRARQPTGRVPSVSGQAAEKADATTDLNPSERPLHDYLTEISERTDVRVGVPLPLGTYARGEGVNFALFSRYASRVRLELFAHSEDSMASRVIDLDPECNRTGEVWHVWIEGIRPGQLYAYRVGGPYQPNDGHRFNFKKLLLDPFATAISRVPNWADPKEKRFACLIHEDERSALCLMFNAGADVIDFGLPPIPPGARWYLAVDTSREAPQDQFAAGEEPLWEDPQTYHLNPLSSVILLARCTNDQRWQTASTAAK
jgi:pullulanase/glycogen debranching enzyme